MKKLYLWLLTLSWAGLTLYLTTIPNFSPSPDTLTSWILSNGGHFFFFGVQGTLVYLAMPKRAFTVKIAVLSTSLYGLLIEFLQLNIPGRSFGISDWMLDTIGALAFIFLLKKLQSRL